MSIQILRAPFRMTPRHKASLKALSKPLDHPETDRLDKRLVGKRLLEEALVRLAPLVERLEPLALVTHELEVELPCRDHARLDHLDHGPRRALPVLDDVPGAGLRRLICSVEAGGGCLVARKHGLDEA